MTKITNFIIGCVSLFGAVQAEDFPFQEVLDMASKDSEVREKWIYDRDVDIRSQELENTARLKEILIRYGLPSGYESDDLVMATHQLVLHSSDLDFQKDFLERISSSGDLWNDAIDVLTDRILLRQDMPQRFGTHLYHDNGSLLPYPIENPERVDELRNDVDEPSLLEYIDIMKALDKASVQKSDGDLYKIVFNMVNEFQNNPADFLYYATFDPNEPQPSEAGSFLAFEDPAVATAYLLTARTSIASEVFYREDLPQHLCLTLSPRSTDDAEICAQTPVYIRWIPRGNYQPHDNYRPLFLDRVLASQEEGKPAAEMQCDSAIEALIMGGSKLCIKGAGMEYEYKDVTVRNKLLTMLYFDVTLENEDFQ